MPTQPLELLAPAKNADIGIEAILHGADAVYIGGPDFGAREEAGNAFDDIRRLCEFAHGFNARVYMTLNTLVSDAEMTRAVQIAWQAYESGVDALIVQDMGLLQEKLPPIQLHASTQCDVRSPEKARFLESIGFSQVVLAREMNLEEIARTRAALKSARIEYFIHGALCVSYSGQCYASFAATGRSANRGACAQLCRLPYSVYTESGKELVRDKHVLSLKDNNQSGNLLALIRAGVSSFKIEGRLKDVQYVKNITAYYRQLLDKIIEHEPQYRRSSDGTSRITFTPDPTKSFNRGYTDYFTRERHHDMAVFGTPKDSGEKIGTIVRVSADSIEVKSSVELHNADGFTYLTREKTLSGFSVNLAQRVGNNLWRLTLRDRPIFKKHPQLAPGTELFRNYDRLWEEALGKPTATRLIGIQMQWSADETGFSLHASDESGNCARAKIKPEVMQPAASAEKNAATIRKNLAKLGGTGFEARRIDVGTAAWFAPASFVNELRRRVVQELLEQRRRHFKRLEPGKPEATLPYPDATDYRANVLNEQAVTFYRNHQAKITEPAVETGEVLHEIALMQTKHCVRYALGLCLKDNLDKVRADPSLKERFKPDPLILKTGPNLFKATFDCRRCEMTLHGKVRTHTSLGHVKSLSAPSGKKA